MEEQHEECSMASLFDEMKEGWTRPPPEQGIVDGHDDVTLEAPASPHCWSLEGGFEAPSALTRWPRSARLA